jgi:hypothetical protein
MICPTAIPTCISTGFASGSQVTSGDIHNSSGLAIGMEQPNQGGSIASGDLSPALSEAHDSYLATTVVPGFLRAAFDTYPLITEAVLPANAVSATITYGNVDSLLTAVASALTFLPGQYWEGFARMVINDDPWSAVQMARSVAPIVAIQTAGPMLAPSTLYHFTTVRGYAGITAAGQILPGAGVTGTGVYGTAVSAPWTVGWAGISTEAVVSFSPGMSAVYPGLFPLMWWRVVPTVTTLFSPGVPVIP